jgi:hypothetical protein
VERYDFGTSPELLFAPCDLEPMNDDDDSDADRCFIGSDGRTYSYDPIIRFPEVVDDIKSVEIKATDAVTLSSSK